VRRRGLQLIVCAAAVLVVLAEHPAAGQAPQAFPPGRLTGSVASRANPGHHYAVYVPTSYRADRPVPVLFIMDYRGRAREAAEVFRPAAEKYGWILISSNDTASDQSPEPSLAALKTMWTDAHDLFAVDSRRLYLAGLSGTARTATWIANQLKGTVAGVIGASAGFSPDLEPSRNLSFLYFGTAGDSDYNYWEMRSLERRLTELDVPHRMEYFAGAHGWMPSSLAMAAVRWMELRAMKAGARSVDPALVEDAWWQSLHDVETLRETGRSAAATRRLMAMARDYSGLRSAGDMATISRLSFEVGSEPWLPTAVASEAAAAASHKARIEAAMVIIARAFPPAASLAIEPVNATLDRLGVPQLLALAGGRDQPAALDARRILSELDVQTGFYLPSAALQDGQPERAAFYLDLAKTINPTDPYAWYLRASVSARAGRTAEALELLSRAVSLGFRTLHAIETDRAFDPLRGDKEFKALVVKIRASWDAAERLAGDNVLPGPAGQ
jgi:poly(3-hydroxybutyrate) depolymerase